MTEVVSIYDAKTQLSALIARVESGEDIIISRHGKPVVQLTLVQSTQPPREPGKWKGKIRMSDDFDDFTEQDERDWYGE